MMSPITYPQMRGGPLITCFKVGIRHVAAVSDDTSVPVDNSNDTWTALDIIANCTVTASFAINTCSVTATAGANGSITPSTQTVDHGAAANITVTAASGYHVDSVTGDACNVSHVTAAIWSIDAITSACTTASTCPIAMARKVMGYSATSLCARASRRRRSMTRSSISLHCRLCGLPSTRC